jgi:hypothetical protein
MTRSPIDHVHLSDHDRYVAQAQLARAEALADAILFVAAKVKGAWSGLVRGVRAWNDARTREWPHPQSLR